MSNTVLAAAFGLALVATPTMAHAQTDQCTSLIIDAEKRYNIPEGLLLAIALTESGSHGHPYPYAMNIGGRPYLAPNNETMANVINRYMSAGQNSIDVGCMQINIKYHARRFSSPYDLLDSATNVDYGARYLTELAVASNSWQDAVMTYHNKNNPSRRAWYGCQVWNNYLRVHRLGSGYLQCGHVPGSATASGLGVTASSHRYRRSQYAMNRKSRGSIELAHMDPQELSLDRHSGALDSVRPDN